MNYIKPEFIWWKKSKINSMLRYRLLLRWHIARDWTSLPSLSRHVCQSILKSLNEGCTPQLAPDLRSSSKKRLTCPLPWTTELLRHECCLNHLDLDSVQEVMDITRDPKSSDIQYSIFFWGSVHPSVHHKSCIHEGSDSFCMSFVVYNVS